ncbi:MAG: hypothetical protein ACREBW_08055, partial [Candidatus Micrarchaeaceae archaeon]
MREVRLDRLIEVEYEGEQLLINIELQTSRDKKMGTLLLKYCLEVMDEYDLPVLSCVIYLQRLGERGEPPWHLHLRGGRRLIWFDYLSIELAEQTT